MSFALFLDVCGLPLLMSLTVLTMVLTVAALMLSFKVKQDDLLRAFQPFCWLPVFMGSFSTLFQCMSSIGLQLNSEAEILVEPAFLMTMAAIPMLTGIVAASIPTTVSMVGRWMLAWQASGLRLFPEKSEQATEIDADEMTSRDTEDYLERLVRSR